ncbi:hypothetical protein EYF80_025696 [Liparis tanakae]|uniref:Uncharacterized protein n=1 Tax=Liparis tanakae TaxID=230148 RepID=A0A4Z2HDW9_9TELE|nr:hypothetical protein EYF80_025696 [Liparis tanakae]
MGNSAPSHSHGDPGGIVSLSSCRFLELRNKRSLILIVQETAKVDQTPDREKRKEEEEEEKEEEEEEETGK